MINIIFYKSFLLIGSLALISCNQKSTDENKKIQDAVAQIDEKKGTFQTSIVENQQASHWAIKAKYTNGQYTFDTTGISVRKGRLPYNINDKTNLPFEVIFLDRANRLIGNYSIENPAMGRTCEEGGTDKRIFTNIDFEILLPANNNISRVQVLNERKPVKDFSISQRPIINNDNRDSISIVR